MDIVTILWKINPTLQISSVVITIGGLIYSILTAAPLVALFSILVFEKSYRFYQTHPVIWENLHFKAWDDYGALDVALVNDLNSRKDFLINFEENGIPRPVIPGETRHVRYLYSVPIEQWGSYIDRPILFRTRFCRVNVKIPAASSSRVGVLEITPLRQPHAVVQPIERTLVGDAVVWKWECPKPTLGSTYRVKWDDPVATSEARVARIASETGGRIGNSRPN